MYVTSVPLLHIKLLVKLIGVFCFQPQLYKSKGISLWSETMCSKNLKLACDQFHHALTLEGTSNAEPWIYHFLLGKILWKLNGSTEVVLYHFVKVSINISSICIYT